MPAALGGCLARGRAAERGMFGRSERGRRHAPPASRGPPPGSRGPHCQDPSVSGSCRIGAAGAAGARDPDPAMFRGLQDTGAAQRRPRRLVVAGGARARPARVLVAGHCPSPPRVRVNGPRRYAAPCAGGKRRVRAGTVGAPAAPPHARADGRPVCAAARPALPCGARQGCRHAGRARLRWQE